MANETMTRQTIHRIATRMAALTGAAILALLAVFGSWQLGQGLYMTAKAQLAFLLIDKAWAETLEDGKPHKAWRWADAWPVAEIEVARLGKREVALSNASGEALAFAPGLVAGSAKPGARGLSVFAAHRDSHFAFLQFIRIGDEIRVTDMAARQYRYIVSKTEIVDVRTSGLDPRQDQGIALVTCYPFEALTHGPLRFVVRADRIIEAYSSTSDLTALSVNVRQVIE